MLNLSAVSIVVLDSSALKFLISNFGLLMLLIFVLVFATWGLAYKGGRGYLRSRPKIYENGKLSKEYQEWTNEQNFSAVLAGFTLAALTFVLTIQQESASLQTIEFFSFAFIFEMLSFMSFKYRVLRAFDYYGTLLQFTGLLALLNGFFTFITAKNFSAVILLAYGMGYLGFFCLSVVQLKAYIDTMKDWNKTICATCRAKFISDGSQKCPKCTAEEPKI